MSESRLWAEYLERHFPIVGERPPRIHRANANECARIAYAYMQTISAGIGALGPHDVPQPSADDIREVDRALATIAMEGTLDAFVELSFGGLYELMDRLTWSVSALTLEEGAASGWSLPLPEDAPQDVQDVVTLLTLLAGPGRDYPPEWPQKRLPWRKADS